jgi:predicted DNA-binding WGR domain protein
LACRLVADHINGDKLDNRRANLRAVTASENARNRRSANATGFKNVTRRWDGQGYEGKLSLGTFTTPEEAAEAVARAEAWLAEQPFSRRLRAVS